MDFCKRFFLLLFLIIIASVSANAYDSTNIKIEDTEAIFSTARPDAGTVFMKIKNDSKTEDSLISAVIDIKGVTAELHDVKNNEMIKVDKIPIPPKSTVSFKRGSYHIMLFNLPLEIKENQEFSLTLKFEKAGEKTVKIKFSSSKHDMMHKH